jgi:hypothetical protein
MAADSAFDPETVAIMGRALDEAWAELESKSWIRAEPEKSGIRRALALRTWAPCALDSAIQSACAMLPCTLSKGARSPAPQSGHRRHKKH